MIKKSGLMGLVLIIFSVALIGAGDVGATQCYDLYYIEDCGASTGWENWDSVKVAFHRDTTWEGGPTGTSMNGYWYVFGNSICVYVNNADGTVPLYLHDQYLCGVKAGTAKIIAGDPFHSKFSIPKAQGFIVPGVEVLGCWYMKKSKNKECSWILE